MTYDNFAIETQEAILKAQYIATNLGQNSIESNHLMQGIIDTDEVNTTKLFDTINIDIDSVKRYLKEERKTFPKGTKGDKQYLSKNSNLILKSANSLMTKFGDKIISNELLILSILSNYKLSGKLVPDLGISVDELHKAIEKGRKQKEIQYSPDKIFISYRRKDSAAAAGRLYDFLELKLGSETLFKDVDSISYGKDFKEEIRNAIDKSKIVLVIIGKYFITDERKLFSSNDYVHYEIAYALEQKKIVIPIMVNESVIPESHELPMDIQKFTTIHGPELRNEKWKRDCEDLLDQLQLLLQ